MTAETLRAGIIGLGRSGWNIHAEALADHSGFEVVAVADPVEERRDEAAARFGCAVYAEPHDLIGDEKVEVVTVATPSHTHVPLAIAAVEAGRHVVVEKPMAQNAAEVDDMITAAKRADRVLTCYQSRRLDPDFMAVQEVIASGRLGELVLIQRTQHRFTRRADWQMLRKYGGGELSNTVAHSLDQVLQLLDDGPIELFADLRHTIGAGDAEDHVKLCLKPETGPVADIESSLTVAIPQPTWLIAGTTGGLTMTRDGLLTRWVDPETFVALELDEGPAAGRQYGTGETINWQEELTNPRGRERTSAQIFYDRLEATLRGNAELFVTPESVRRQIELMEQARAQTGVL